MNLPDELVIDFTLDDLTIAEVEQFEAIIGGPIESAFVPGAKRGVVHRAMAFLALKRQGHDVTMADVGNMKFSAVTVGQAKADVDRPT